MEQGSYIEVKSYHSLYANKVGIIETKGEEKSQVELHDYYLMPITKCILIDNEYLKEISEEAFEEAKSSQGKSF